MELSQIQKEVTKIFFGLNDDHFVHNNQLPQWFNLTPSQILNYIIYLFDTYMKELNDIFSDGFWTVLDKMNLSYDEYIDTTNNINTSKILNVSNNSRKIFGITGRKFNGKDTIALFLCNKYNFKQLAFADVLKTGCGYLFQLSHDQLHGDLKETPIINWFNLTPRQILQFVGTNIFRDHMKELHVGFGDVFWLLATKAKINNISKDIVISDVRFPNEVEFVKNLNGKVIRVTRNTNTNTDNHISEQLIDQLNVDYDLKNNGTKEDLYHLIDELLNNIE